MKLQLKKFESLKDITGSLVPFYKNKSLNNFNIKRFFFIYGKKKYMRANHAHRKCNQILIPINGTIKIDIFNLKKMRKTFTLSQKNKNYLLVPSFHLMRIKFLQEDGIMLTLCDYEYNRKEYIQEDEFFNL